MESYYYLHVQSILLLNESTKTEFNNNNGSDVN